MTETETPKKRRFPISLALIIIILIFSITALYQAMNAYLSTPPMVSEGNYFLLLGIIGLAMSAYMLMRTRRVTPQISFEMQRVSTTIECKKCGFKKIRPFEVGDYIMKEVEPCPKCEEKMMITSIYREETEEEKRSS